MQLHTRTWGDAALPKTAVLIHGIAGSAGAWTRTAGALVERGYRCIAPDLRGHGESRNHDDDYEMSTLVDDVVTTVPTAPDLLIGFSLGGGISLLGAGANRLQPKRLVLIDPAVRWRGRESALALLHAAETRPRDVDSIMTANPTWHRIDAEERSATLEQTDWPKMRRILAECQPWDARPAVAALADRIPTLFVLADPSANVPPDVARQFRQQLGPGSVITIPGTSHSVHRDEFTSFLAVLDAWIDQGR
jgi:pimeloyl-ACP methyl ester carboxylesterase